MNYEDAQKHMVFAKEFFKIAEENPKITHAMSGHLYYRAAEYSHRALICLGGFLDYDTIDDLSLNNLIGCIESEFREKYKFQCSDKIDLDHCADFQCGPNVFKPSKDAATVDEVRTIAVDFITQAERIIKTIEIGK